jgi:electron transport complex protein RnfB
MPFIIVAESCTGCTACEKRCPTKAISGEPKKSFFIEPALCIDCGACGVICPDEAILDTFGNITHVLKKAQRPIAIVHPDNCNGCGVCVRVCPVNNIQIVDGRPVWQHKCEMCFACDEWCPRNAIHHWSRAEGVKYHHPAVSIGDMYRRE